MRSKWRLWAPIQWKNEQGFALLEIAIALTILGALLGPGFSTWRSYSLLKKQRITIENQKLVFQALAGYLEFNGCLPRPIAIDSATWDNPPVSSQNTQANKPGLIPYHALGLPAHVAKDGFGHWMSYAVDAAMTVAYIRYQDQICTAFYKEPSQLDVIVHGQSVKDGMRSHHSQDTHCARFPGIAVVLVSHGMQGWGAPKSPGKRIPIPPSALPHIHQNGGGSLTFCAPTASDMIPGGLVTWKTRDQILAAAHIHCFDSFYLKTPPSKQDTAKNHTHNSPPLGSFSFKPTPLKESPHL